MIETDKIIFLRIKANTNDPYSTVEDVVRPTAN